MHILKALNHHLKTLGYKITRHTINPNTHWTHYPNLTIIKHQHTYTQYYTFPQQPTQLHILTQPPNPHHNNITDATTIDLQEPNSTQQLETYLQKQP